MLILMLNYMNFGLNMIYSILKIDPIRFCCNVASGACHKLAFDSKNRSSSTFGCGVCLWVFESKSELEIHNYLEHIIINHSEHKIS